MLGNGGETGIRTLGTIASSTVFETAFLYFSGAFMFSQCISNKLFLIIKNEK